MTDQNGSRSDSAATKSQVAREAANISDRVQTLREKTTTLSETLDRIERDLRERRVKPRSDPGAGLPSGP